MQTHSQLPAVQAGEEVEVLLVQVAQVAPQAATVLHCTGQPSQASPLSSVQPESQEQPQTPEAQVGVALAPVGAVQATQVSPQKAAVLHRVGQPLQASPSLSLQPAAQAQPQLPPVQVAEAFAPVAAGHSTQALIPQASVLLFEHTQQLVPFVSSRSEHAETVEQ